jgi:DNA-binding transcriptional LysR family regulator
MQIEALKVFCDLAETESFTQAAKINGVTQSAVSQTLSSMEAQLKSHLVERSKKNFRLTSEGEVVYDYAKRILQSFGAVQSKMQELQNVVTGDIRISAVYSIGLHDLPPCIKQFMKEHPEVNIRVDCRRNEKVYADVQGNIADLGLVAYPVHQAQLETVPLRGKPLVLVCHPAQPLAKSRTVKFKALAGQKFVSFEPDMPTRKVLDRIFKEHGVKVRHALQFDNIETIKQAVEMNLGMAILPEGTVQQEVANHTLAALRLEGNYMRQLGIIYKKGKVLSPAMKGFIELLKRSL